MVSLRRSIAAMEFGIETRGVHTRLVIKPVSLHVPFRSDSGGCGETSYSLQCAVCLHLGAVDIGSLFMYVMCC